MNSAVKEIIDEAKQKLKDEEYKHPKRFLNQSYSRGKLISYINIAKEKNTKENAKGYASWLEKEFWQYIGNHSIRVVAALFLGSCVGLIILWAPLWLFLSWLGINNSETLAACVAVFIGFVVVDGIFFDKTIENFKAGMLYEKSKGDQKYDEALEAARSEKV